ncbi:MAG TPA: 3-carboxy-cis,cis-muconate cycloisomerase [Caulobacteraceae bacterium]|nr:3-carboxy-cis,cis-muconate cycloisomerase [Caulobacteraceae bacterium]
MSASLIRDWAATTPEMLAAFGDEALIGAALAFEIALARAMAAEGLIPAAAADAIAEACATPPGDAANLAREAAHAGALAIPLVRRIRARVADAHPEFADAVHRGATSQDVADTALMLMSREAGKHVDADLLRLRTALAGLTRRHAATPMLGRTLMQPAMPITFGLKTAGWMLGVEESRARFARERDAALRLQLGGPAGTLAGFRGRGTAVSKRMAAALGLAPAITPWHSRRDTVAGLGCALALVTCAVGKIARDISLLSQAEVGEAREPRVEGRGGSSSMAHKRNPTGCQVALSAAIRAPGLASTLLSAMPQEHERGLGGWQAEGPVLVELFELAHGAISAMAAVIGGLEVSERAMARNLAAAGVGSDTGEAEALAHRALAAIAATEAV